MQHASTLSNKVALSSRVGKENNPQQPRKARHSPEDGPRLFERRGSGGGARVSRLRPQGAVPGRIISWGATFVVLAALMAGCATTDRSVPSTSAAVKDAASADAEATERCTILHINDVYRIGGADEGMEGGMPRLRTLRVELEKDYPDLLTLHAGDFLYPSLMSRLYDGEQMVDAMNRIDGDPDAFDDRMFVTFGNHEFDVEQRRGAELLNQRLEESQFTWFGTNIDFTTDTTDGPVVRQDLVEQRRIVDCGGLRVGLFGVTLDDVQTEYIDRYRDPIAVAREETQTLRDSGADVVIALTHLSMAEDVALLEALGPDGPDLSLGGHEHDKQSQNIGGRLVIKADAEARTASVVHVAAPASPGEPPVVDFEFRELGSKVQPDPDLQAAVDAWTERHEREFCAAKDRAPDCLSQAVGRTQVELVGEEIEIRKYETNLGNWILDQALAAYAPHGAHIAFVNSGSLRLNQDIPADHPITLRHVEEIFQYPSGLAVLRLNGALLQEIVDAAVTDWTGQGKWLQISGFAFRHDPETESATDLTLLTDNGSRPIDPNEEIFAVTGTFLAAGNDGYTMLNEELVVDGMPELSLRDLFIEGLTEAGDTGIAPTVEGRICNSQQKGPCLAVD